MKKRILSLLLVICMVAVMLPVSVLADDTKPTGYVRFFTTEAGRYAALTKNAGDAPSYYIKSSVQGEYFTDTGATEQNYVIKVDYPADGVMTVYLRGAHIQHNTAANIASLNLGDPTAESTVGRQADYKIVVEADSIVENSKTNGNLAAGICCWGTGSLTVTSVDDARLTVKTNLNRAMHGHIHSDGNLILKDANLYSNHTLGTATLDSYKSITIDGGSLNINSTAAEYGAFNAVNAGNASNVGNITIQNGAVVNIYHHITNAQRSYALNATGGDITISDSWVTLGSNKDHDYNYLFGKAPVLGNEKDTGEGAARTPAGVADDTTGVVTITYDGKLSDFRPNDYYSYRYVKITPHVHTPATDDGDCTTAVMCTACGEEAVAAKTHVPGADDGDCTTAIKCTNTGCTKDAVEAKAAHTDNRTDCAVAGSCTVCGTAIAAGSHSSTGNNVATCKTKAKCDLCSEEYGELAACKPEADDGDCTTDVKCSVCKEVVTAAKEHKYTNNTDTTCDNAGCTHTRTVETPSDKPNNNKNPQTGDQFNMALWVSLLVASAVGFVTVLVFGKKRAVK